MSHLSREKGNLFENIKEGDMLVQCISRDANMGAGIAVQFKKKYKGMQSYIKQTISQEYKTTGIKTKAVFWNTGKVTICNLITKSKYYQKPSYLSLQASLDQLARYLSTTAQKPNRLIMPQIGCGLDRLSWAKVADMLIKTFPDIKIVIYYL